MSNYYVWVNGDFVHPKQAPAGIFMDGEENAVSFVHDFRILQTENGPAIFRLAEYVRNFMDLVRNEAFGVHLSEDQVCDSIYRTILYNGIKEGYVRTRLLVQKKTGRDQTGLVLAVIPQAYFAEEKPSRNRGGVALQNNVPKSASLFLVKNRVITTPSSEIFGNAMIRSAVITLARDLGYEVRETPVTREQIAEADEVFLSMAVGEIEHVSTFNGRTLGQGQAGPVTRELQSSFYSTMRGKGKRSREWLDWISSFFLGI